jgi:peptidoglycan/LPS O-acetylase OafA/YrhL
MNEQRNVPDQSIWFVLSGLRFFFAFWVLCAHTYNLGLHSRAMPVPSQSGLVAVLCFFAISGFSIHHSISSEPNGYYRRRLARVLPTHFAAVGLTLVAYLCFGTLYGGGSTPYPMPNLICWVAYFSLLNLFIVPTIIDVLFPLWSLSIEVLYYAIAPSIKGRPAYLIVGMIVVSGLITIGFSIFNGHPNVWLAPYGGQVIIFAWAWLAGWLAYLAPRNVLCGLLCMLIGCAAIWTNPEAFWLVEPHVLYWTYGSWIVTLAILFFPPRLKLNPQIKAALIYLGDLSFPLYLIHYPILFTVSTAVWQKYPGLNYGWVQAIIAVAAAHLVLRHIDRPLRRAISTTSMAAPPSLPVGIPVPAKWPGHP